LLFLSSWIILYLIYPSWALPVRAAVRAVAFASLSAYIVIWALIAKRLINSLEIGNSVIMPVHWRNVVSNHSAFVGIILLAMVLHIPALFRPILILGDETIHLQGGLLIYEYINSNWHNIFQIVFWLFVVLLILTRKFLLHRESYIKKLLSPWIIYPVAGAALIAYFFLSYNIPYDIILIRYPPMSKIIYFLAYTAFGISHVVPRALQLLFYLLSAIFIYRTLHLFGGRGVSLVGATLYLFLPVAFAYSGLGELASGTICFISVISFYLLRFLKERNDRDLLLSVYLIGVGFMYKDPVFLTFPVCALFLLYYTVKRLIPYKKLKVLLLAVAPVIPWMIITKLFSWRNYTFQLSNFTSVDGKLFTYVPLLASNLSLLIFVIFVLSAIYLCFLRRNLLINYFGVLFLTYYFFIVSDMAWLSPRFAMTFYLSIVVYVAVFAGILMEKVRWRFVRKVGFIVFLAYMLSISAAAPVDSEYLQIMNRKLIYFPSEEALKWIKENLKGNEKVLSVRVMSANFYRVKYNIEKERLINLWYETDRVSTPEKLRNFCRRENIAYIIFPYSPAYPRSSHTIVLEYLKNNSDNNFIETARFSRENNFIYIYKVNFDQVQ